MADNNNKVIILNTSNAPWTFRYMTKDGPDGEPRQVTVGAKADNLVIDPITKKLRPQPKVEINADVWGKIRADVMALVGDGITDDIKRPLRVLGA